MSPPFITKTLTSYATMRQCEQAALASVPLDMVLDSMDESDADYANYVKWGKDILTTGLVLMRFVLFQTVRAPPYMCSMSVQVDTRCLIHSLPSNPTSVHLHEYTRLHASTQV